MKRLFFLFSLFLLTSCVKEGKTKPIENTIRQESEHKALIIPLDINLLNDASDSVRLYYKKMNFQEIWDWDENRKDLLSEIKKCTEEGLHPEDYSYEALKKLERNRKTLSAQQRMAYDILLTQSFEKLALHLHSGKLNPKKTVYQLGHKTEKNCTFTLPFKSN